MKTLTERVAALEKEAARAASERARIASRLERLEALARNGPQCKEFLGMYDIESSLREWDKYKMTCEPDDSAVSPLRFRGVTCAD